MGIANRALDTSLLTLKGIGISSQEIPSSFKKRASRLSGRICDQLGMDKFELGLKLHQISLIAGGKERLFSRKHDAIDDSLWSQAYYLTGAFWRSVLGSDVRTNADELVALFEELQLYMRDIHGRELSPVVDVKTDLIPPARKGHWSSFVGNCAPKVTVLASMTSLLKSCVKAIVGSKVLAALYLTYLGQVFAFISSTSNFEKSTIKKEHAVTIKDADGAIQALSSQVSSVFSFSIVALGVISEILDPSLYAHAIEVMGKSISFLVPISTVLGYMRSSYRLRVDERFIKTLHSYTKHPGLKEKQKALGALQFLRRNLFVTEQEAKGLTEEEVAKLAIRKKEALERKIDKEIVQTLYEKTLGLLSDLHAGSQEEALLQAKSLLDAVEHAAEQTEFQDQVSVLLSTISLVGMIALYAGTGGIPYEVLVLTAAINLLINAGQVELVNSAVVPVARKLGFTQVHKLRIRPPLVEKQSQ